MRINHLHLDSANVSRSIEFYERYFGLRKRSEHHGLAFLEDDGGLQMAIGPLEKPADFPSWFHFGFAKVDPDQVRSLYRNMKADGVQIAKELVDKEGCVTFHCYDPSGYKVEVSCIKADF